MSTSQGTITSIIHEYEILYTARVIQKSKKWNDGKLKFYEFNRKIEIHNESGHLIATDFYKNKPVGVILEKLFFENNEFKLPNANFLIQIQGKLRDFEREVNLRVKNEDSQGSQKNGSLGVNRRATQDLPFSGPRNSVNTIPTPKRRVVNARTLVIKEPPITPSKNPPVKRPLHVTPQIIKVVNQSIDATSLNVQKNMGTSSSTAIPNRKIGLPRTKSTPKPKTNDLLTENVGQFPLVSHKPLLRMDNYVKSQIGDTVLEDHLRLIDQRVAKRSCIRILPKTSTYYQYLFSPTEQEDDNKIHNTSLAPILGSLGTGRDNTQRNNTDIVDNFIDDVDASGQQHSVEEHIEEDEEDDYKIRILDDDDDDDDDVLDEIGDVDVEEEFEVLEKEIDNEEKQEEDIDYEPLSSSNEISEPVEPSQIKALERKIVQAPKDNHEISDSENEILDSTGLPRVQLKQEQPFRISNKTIEDADMVYDLSEIEQDEKFSTMLEEMRKGQKALTHGRNKRRRVSKEYNEAAEFNLSTDSDMEEI